MNLYFIVYSFTRIMVKYLIRKSRAKKKKNLGKICRNTLGKIPGVATDCTLKFQSQKSLTSIWNIKLLNEKDQVNKKLNKIRIWNTKERKTMKKIHILLRTKNL